MDTGRKEVVAGRGNACTRIDLLVVVAVDLDMLVVMRQACPETLRESMSSAVMTSCMLGSF